ncbi:MAG: bifunctional [glutamine synthetase] adenylyltransferase/[glutamine synthetase]-adenylyl-L-tyrosine phosphorylase [Pseudomonadota bacterium]
MTSPRALSETIKTAPVPYDLDAAAQMRDAFGAEFFALPTNAQALLNGVAGSAPYLRRLISRAPARVSEMLNQPLDTTLHALCTSAQNAGATLQDDAQLSALRQVKNEAALAIALGDIGGAIDVVEAAAALSEIADALIASALAGAARNLDLAPSAPGLVVLAMGKLGAHELNYSSDIDLIVLYEPAALAAGDPDKARKLAIALTRDLVDRLQRQTADGYVYRTDLRLRPDPGFSAIALTIDAAESYYEAHGQNWERMAFVKARAAAGDLALGEQFLNALRPFIWRKYLDYAAIDDVKAVKRQIQSARGGHDIEFAGHDLKLGRGGIREVEFYAQTQQLILGGKNSALRSKKTLEALKALAEFDHVDATAAAELDSAYRYLRRLEHRLQMINDEQTHKIPTQAEAIDRLTAFAGAPDANALRDDVLNVLRTVRDHYDALFADADDDDESTGALVFTGVDDDPATLETLRELGFRRPEEVAATVRAWHAGGTRATRTERARGLLTKFQAPLMRALSAANDPDAAFFAFDGFMKNLPAGVQVFSLLAQNPSIFDALISMVTISPYLRKEMSRRPERIEGLIEGAWADAPPSATALRDDLAAVLVNAEDFEAALNSARRWAADERFLAAGRLMAGVGDYEQAAVAFSAIADAVIQNLLGVAHDEIRRRHGDIEGGVAVLGLGGLGARDLTATSDLDLMFIYDAPAGAQSDGSRPLGATEYFTRFVRRVVTALSAATQEGALYDVDMQLRPSGGAGPAAVSFDAFRQYYHHDAWTWEIMALTKARFVAGAPDLAAAVEAETVRILGAARDPAAVANDVNDMRRRLLDAKKPATIWDLKTTHGGATDIAFICQYLLLTLGDDTGRAPQRVSATIEWLAERGALSEESARLLAQTQSLYDAILQTARAGAGGVFDPATAGGALNNRMAFICEAPTIAAAEAFLTERHAQIVELYATVLGLTPVGAPETR